MLKLFGKIFGTTESIKEQLAEIDRYKIPEEDKIQMRIDVFNSYSAFKIMQRAMALFVTLTYLMGLILAMIYHFKGLDFEGVIKIAAAFEVGLVMLIVAGFYFGGGALDSLKGKTTSINYKQL